MARLRTILLPALVMAGIASSAAGQFALPKPEVFVRAEDRLRARLLLTPCKKADIGHGCYRFDGRAIREAPCTYHIEPGTIGSLPTDQCYKMQPPRRYRGVWVDEFEGQAFIPEGSTLPEWPRGDPKSPAWRKQFDRAQASTIWLDVKRVHIDRQRPPEGRKVLIDFIGRKTMYQGNYGHMGLSGNEIIVDRVIAIRACPSKGICNGKPLTR